jgi:hypothetical protein
MSLQTSAGLRPDMGKRLDRAVRTVEGLGLLATALGVRVSYQEDRVQRVTLLWVLPVFDRARWEARQARKAAKAKESAPVKR